LREEETARIGRNVLPEHRAILEAALAQLPEPSLFEILASMPDAGEDSDFARSRS
jgi:antitoxin FitA